MITDTLVPLPVCSGADSCAISVSLKPYLYNCPPWVCLTCGWSRFKLHSPLSLCCTSGKISIHYQHNLILTGMFDSFSLVPAFRMGGIVTLACLKSSTDYILFLMYKLLHWMLSFLKSRNLCVPTIILL